MRLFSAAVPFKRFEFAALPGIGIAYFAYLILRLINVPMTQDEVATCYNHVPRGVWDIITYGKEAVPNNHILNTLSIKLLAGVLGMGQVAARIPALAGGMLYLIGAMCVARTWGSNGWMRIFGYVILLGNPFMAEFFALGRGYGLSIGLMMPAIYFTWKYTARIHLPDLLAALALGGLAVWANFTVLNFYLPMVLLLFLIIWQQDKPERRKNMAILAAGVSILGALCFLPIYRMTADNELRFWGTAGFYQDTLEPLVRSSVMNHLFIGEQTVPVFAGLIGVFSLAGWVVAIWRWSNRKWRVGPPDLLVFAGFLFAGAVTVNLLQHFVLNVPFLNPRTAIFLYPLFALQLIAVGELLWRKWRQPALLFILPLLAFTGSNFNINSNLKQSYEWSYDRGTFDVLDFIKGEYQRTGRSTPYALDTYWLLQNSLNFHVEFGRPFHPAYSHWVLTPPYHGNQPPAGNSDFFYTGTKEDFDVLLGTYEPVLTIQPGTYVLMRRLPEQAGSGR